MTVSIAVITYNHEPYIREALDSILMQKTDFDIEIIIGDDCSTDATPAICSEYAAKYPNVKYERYAVNEGISSNWIKTISRCQGDFIALLEGDDFWTCADKLQIQVDFLNKHKEYVLCYHAFTIEQQDSSREYTNFRNKLNADKKTIGFIDVLQMCYPQTLTVVFRKGTYNLSLLTGLKVCDRFLYQLLLLHSEGCYMDKEMGSYRIHGAQVTFNQKSEKLPLLDDVVFCERLLMSPVSSRQKHALRLFLTKRYFQLYTIHSKGVFNRYLKRGLIFYLRSYWSKEKVVIKNSVGFKSIVFFIMRKVVNKNAKDSF